MGARHIVSCTNDLKCDRHELAVYSRHDLHTRLAHRCFDSMVTLSSVNSHDIICFTAHRYLVLEAQNLTTVDEFTRNFASLGPEKFVLLNDSSRRCFYFKSIDETTERVRIKVVDRVDHETIVDVPSDANDFFRADWDRDVLFVKNVFLKDIYVIDVPTRSEINRSSSELAKFFFVALSPDGHIYSVNYFSKKIVYI